MREQKVLANLLRQIADLVEQEAEKNPEFSEKLEAVLAPVRSRRAALKTLKPEVKVGDLPDILAERKTRAGNEFEFWLRDLGSPMLRALIKHHGFDLTKRSQKWKEPEKLARLISQQLHARLSRGASFLNRGEKTLGTPAKLPS